MSEALRTLLLTKLREDQVQFVNVEDMAKLIEAGLDNAVTLPLATTEHLVAAGVRMGTALLIARAFLAGEL